VGAVAVPKEAVRYEGEARAPYVYEVSGGRIARRAVVIGVVDDDLALVGVTQGVAVGDTVIVGPIEGLAEGTPVQIGAGAAVVGRGTR
jgi:hypothetical protein